jgi:hypothetical protein
MVIKVGTFLWPRHLYPQKCFMGPNMQLGLHNYKNNKCDFTSHYFDFTTRTNIIVINLISPNNKDKHHV